MVSKTVLLVTVGLLVGCAGHGAPDANTRAPSQPPDPAQQQIVLGAADAVMRLRSEDRYPGFSHALASAEGILIIPRYFRLGWMFGVGGGNGVLLARDAFGKWGPPAFYDLARGSYGWQVGAEGGSLVYLFLDRQYMMDGLSSGFDFGADAEVTALTSVDRTGRSNLEGGTPVLLYTDMYGIFAGTGLHGGRLGPNASANAAYYGEALEPEDIVLRWKGWRKEAQPLWEALDTGPWEPADDPAIRTLSQRPAATVEAIEVDAR